MTLCRSNNTVRCDCIHLDGSSDSPCYISRRGTQTAEEERIFLINRLIQQMTCNALAVVSLSNPPSLRVPDSAPLNGSGGLQGLGPPIEIIRLLAHSLLLLIRMTNTTAFESLVMTFTGGLLLPFPPSPKGQPLLGLNRRGLLWGALRVSYQVIPPPAASSE